VRICEDPDKYVGQLTAPPTDTNGVTVAHPPTSIPALSTSATNFNWLISSFLKKTAGVEQGVIVSSDGILMATAELDQRSAERVAAIVTGMRSLADGASILLKRGDLNRVIIEMGTAFLLVAAISDGSALGIVCDKRADLGHISYEMTLLVDRVGTQLTPELVTELKRAYAINGQLR
jgi:uncharacterized protein